MTSFVSEPGDLDLLPASVKPMGSFGSLQWDWTIRSFTVLKGFVNKDGMLTMTWLSGKTMAKSWFLTEVGESTGDLLVDMLTRLCSRPGSWPVSAFALVDELWEVVAVDSQTAVWSHLGCASSALGGGLSHPYGGQPHFPIIQARNDKDTGSCWVGRKFDPVSDNGCVDRHLFWEWRKFCDCCGQVPAESSGLWQSLGKWRHMMPSREEREELSRPRLHGTHFRSVWRERSPSFCSVYAN